MVFIQHSNTPNSLPLHNRKSKLSFRGCFLGLILEIYFIYTYTGFRTKTASSSTQQSLYISPSHRYGSLVKASMAKPALLKTSGRLLTCSSQVCPLISKTSEGFSHLPPTEKIKEYCFSYKTDFFFCRNYITHYIPFHSKYEVEKPFVELLIDQFFFFSPKFLPPHPLPKSSEEAPS